MTINISKHTTCFTAHIINGVGEVIDTISMENYQDTYDRALQVVAWLYYMHIGKATRNVVAVNDLF